MDRCILKRCVLQIQPNKAASLRHVWRAAFEIGQALSTGYDAFDFGKKKKKMRIFPMPTALELAHGYRRPR